MFPEQSRNVSLHTTPSSIVSVCIDAGPLENGHRERGIGSVTRHLLHAITPDMLRRHGIDATYLSRRPLPTTAEDGVAPAVRWAPRRWVAELSRASAHVPRQLTPWLQALDTQWSLARDIADTGATVFLTPDPAAVALSRRFRTVALLYDVAPLLFPPRYFSGGRPGLHRLLDRPRLRRLRRADCLLAISEATKRDAVTLAGFDADHITVVPLAVDHTVFRPLDPARARRDLAQQLGLERPYVLFVGADDVRKNLDRLLAAYDASVRRAGIDLVVVGAGTDVAASSNATHDSTATAEGRVRRLGHVAREDLIQLYAGALAFAFPTLYEGFGLPVLEAMACGTPVLTSPVSSIPEVAGDAALFADPQDTSAIAAALTRITNDAVLRRDLRDRGLARAGLFSWERTADTALAVCAAVGRGGVRAVTYRSVAGRPNNRPGASRTSETR